MVQFTVNGTSQKIDIDPDTPVLWAVRPCENSLVLLGRNSAAARGVYSAY